jgi:hypothetical protein
MLGNVMGAIRADGKAPGFAGFDAVEIIIGTRLSPLDKKNPGS